MRTNKVCIISKCFYPNDTRLCQQVKVLNKFNVLCDVLCVKEKGQKKIEYVNDIRIFRVTEIKLTKKTFFNYLKETIIFMVCVSLKLFILSFKSSYKIIIVHTLPEFMVLTTLLHKLSGSVIVLDGRDLTVDLLESRWPDVDTFLKQIAIYLEKFVTFLCEEIITASNGFKRSLLNRGVPEEKITVLINTADETIFKYIEYKDNRVISENAHFIYHGTVSERFGIIIAVEAMSIVCKYIPMSEFHIYGIYDPLYKKRIEKLIEELNLQLNVILHNTVSQQEIYQQIFSMDIGIVPYLSDHFMNIALSTKTFEYIASGLPVTASKLKSSEELFGFDSIHYCEPGNPEDLAKKVIDLCTNPQLRESKRSCAFELFQKYYKNELQYKKYMEIINYYMKNGFKDQTNTKKRKLVGTYNIDTN